MRLPGRLPTETDRDYAIRVRREDIAKGQDVFGRPREQAVLDVWARQIAELEKLPQDASFTDVIGALRKERE